MLQVLETTVPGGFLQALETPRVKEGKQELAPASETTPLENICGVQQLDTR